jgi:hypothetical protein
VPARIVWRTELGQQLPGERLVRRARAIAVRLELTDLARAPTIRFGEVSDQPAAIPSMTAPSPGTLPIGVRDPSELIRNSKTVPPPPPASA